MYTKSCCIPNTIAEPSETSADVLKCLQISSKGMCIIGVAGRREGIRASYRVRVIPPLRSYWKRTFMVHFPRSPCVCHFVK